MDNANGMREDPSSLIIESLVKNLVFRRGGRADDGNRPLLQRFAKLGVSNLLRSDKRLLPGIEAKQARGHGNAHRVGPAVFNEHAASIPVGHEPESM